MNRRLVFGLIAASCLAGAGAARAQTTGYLLPCSAASQLGSGCTLLANTGDPSTMLSDPAALAGLGARGLSISGAAFMPSLHYANAMNSGQDGKSNVFPMPAVFFADRTRGGLTLGLAAQTIGGMGADYSLANAVLGANQRYHSKVALMKGGLAAAYQVTPQLAIGAMVGALYGQLEFATPYSINPMTLAGMAGLAQDPSYAAMMAGFTEATAYTELTGLTGFGLSGAVSVHYQPSSRLHGRAGVHPRHDADARRRQGHDGHECPVRAALPGHGGGQGRRLGGHERRERPARGLRPQHGERDGHQLQRRDGLRHPADAHPRAGRAAE